MRTVAIISAEITAHDEASRARRSALNQELIGAQKQIRFECDGCHRAVKAGEATVIQELEFRCPGQTGGYFVDAGRSLKCPHCKAETNPCRQPEIDALPNGIFAKIEKRELP